MANEKRLIDANKIEYPSYFYEDEVHPDPFIEGYRQGKIDAICDIKALAPTVEAVEVKHGRWAAVDDDFEELEGEEEAMRWGCSSCREIVEYDDWTHRSRLTRYCPNCGAKMDGDGNG